MNINVAHPDIIGRIKLGLFNLINGHMYFQNKVIKIRYDLLRTEQANQLSENQIFDTYQDLLDLK